MTRQVKRARDPARAPKGWSLRETLAYLRGVQRAQRRRRFSRECLAESIEATVVYLAELKEARRAKVAKVGKGRAR